MKPFRLRTGRLKRAKRQKCSIQKLYAEPHTDTHICTQHALQAGALDGKKKATLKNVTDNIGRHSLAFQYLTRMVTQLLVRARGFPGQIGVC